MSQTPDDKVERVNSVNKAFYALLITLLLVVTFIVWQLPRITQYNSGAPVFAVIAIVALVSAIALYGLLHSSGKFRTENKKPKYTIEFGGPAALFVVVLIIGINHEQMQRRDSFGITIYLIQADSRQEIVKTKGYIILRSNPPRKETFRDGTAEFRELPYTENGRLAEYSIDIDNYELDTNAPQSLLLQKDTSINIPIRNRKKGADSPPIQGDAAQKESPDTVSSKKNDETAIIKSIDEDFEKLASIESRNDRIRKLNDQIKKAKEFESNENFEIISRIAGMNYLLSLEYENVFRFDRAIDVLSQQFVELKKIYDKDPKWRPDPRAPAIAMGVARNRIRLAFITLQQHRGIVDEKLRQMVNNTLLTATEAAQKIDDEELIKADAWLAICITYMANENILDAKSALKNARDCAGNPGSPTAESETRQVFFGNYYLLEAVIHAEEKNCIEALSSLKKGQMYLPEKFDAHGGFGYVYLQIARSSLLEKDIKEAIENSINEFKLGDQCESCRYNWACALSKKVELSTGEEKTKLMEESSEHIKWVLDRLANDPVKIDISSILADPFLQSIVNTEENKKIIKSYQWKGEPTKLVTQPIAMTYFGVWQTGLWNAGIPLEGLSFSRLNTQKSKK